MSTNAELAKARKEYKRRKAQADKEQREKRAQEQREPRAARKALGHVRLDITIPKELYARLQPHIRPYYGETSPGYALVAWLDTLNL
jgi:hypothetical protein